MTLFIKGCFGKRKEMKMKKVLRVLLLLVLMVPVMVFADVAGPENKPFEVEVKKSDGIPYYDYYSLKKDEALGTIPKGVTFTVYYQTVYEGVSYVGGYYEDKSIYVKASDVVAKGELDVDDSSVYDRDEAVKIKIVGEAILRKGPSEAYEETTTIKDIETTFTYFVMDPFYVYIDYKGDKGWLDINKDNIYFDGGNYITSERIRNRCGEIPANTIVEDVWKSDLYSNEVEFDYKGCTFNIDTEDNMSFNIMTDKIYVYELEEDIELYPDYSKGNSETIEEGSEIRILSGNPRNEYGEMLYYVEYKKLKGWVMFDPEEEARYVKSIEREDNKKDSDEDDEETDSNTIVIVCIVVGVAVAFTALGVILYLATKKKEGEKNEKTA